MNLDYIAGFTDGEGCFCVCGRGPRIDWGQNAPEVLEKIKEYLDSLGFHTNLGTIKANILKRRPNPITHLFISRRTDCRKLCELLKPFLITKRADCEKLLRWLDEHPAKQNCDPVSIDTIKALHAENYLGTFIAKRLGISRSRLGVICRQHGIKFKSGGRTQDGKRLTPFTKSELRERSWKKEKSKPCLDCGKLIWKYSGVRCNSCAVKYRHLTQPESFKGSNTKSAQGAESR